MPPEIVRVDLLTQAECASCEDAKEILADLAQEFSLEVRTVDLASPEGRRLAAAGGVLFPPGILLDGWPFSYGRPSAKKLRRELARRAAPRASEVAGRPSVRDPAPLSRPPDA